MKVHPIPHVVFETTSSGFIQIWSLLCKVYSVWHNKCAEELSFMTLKRDAKFEEKLTCCLENDMTNLANFHLSTWQSQNQDFDRILLSKVENVWA